MVLKFLRCNFAPRAVRAHESKMATDVARLGASKTDRNAANTRSGVMSITEK